MMVLFYWCFIFSFTRKQNINIYIYDIRVKGKYINFKPTPRRNSYSMKQGSSIVEVNH